MKRLLIYLKEYKKECVLAPLFKMFEAILELFVPLVMAKIIDIGIDAGDIRYIMQMGLVLIGLAVVGVVASVTAQYFSAKAAIGWGTKVRHALFKHIQSLSFMEMDEIGLSTLITRMTTDINSVQACVNMVLRLFLRSPFIVFGAMIMAFTVDVKSAMVFVVAIPLLSVVIFGIMYITIPMYKQVQSCLDTILNLTRENLTGARVIRAFNREKAEIDNFHVKNNDLTTIQKSVGRISGLTNPLTYFIVNGALIALIWIGGIQVNIGYLEQGMVVALVNYMTQILVELVKLANLIIMMTKAVASGKRIEAVFEMHSSLEERTLKEIHQTSDNMVTFEDVSFAYKGSNEPALEHIHLTVKKGEVVGIIGGTGSGKSTLVNLIPRFYDATSGAVKIEGVNVKDMPLSEVRQRVGVVLQKAMLFKGTIRDNLKWGKPDATDEEIWQAIQVAQAESFVREKEGNLDFVIEQGGKNLSGGQKQRLTIARAVVCHADILILDDSASALDFATDAALRMAIKDLNPHPTVFIVSQRAASIMYANQIIVLDDGHIVGHGTHDTLLKSCAIYKEIYDSQFKKEA